MERANAACAFDQGEHRSLAGVWTFALFRETLVGVLVPLGTADVSLVDLDRFTLAAERRELAIAHRLAEPHGHEPSGVELNAKDTGELVAADPLLAAAHQVRRLQPQRQRGMAGLEHGPDCDRELAAAVVAFPEAEPELAFRVLLARLAALRS